MSKHNVWMSVSDLMTGLMIIFLFIAIAYMSRVEQNQSVLTEYIETKKELHAKLVKEFEGDTLKWQMAIGTDLSMKFNNPTVLFAQGSWNLTPQFEDILDEFLPRYFDILLNDSLRSDILEIRLEGHTDNVPINTSKFESNDVLSSYRALAMFDYLVQNTSLDPSMLKHSGRGEYIPVADNSTPEGRAKNRRIEIKIYNTLSGE